MIRSLRRRLRAWITGEIYFWDDPITPDEDRDELRRHAERCITHHEACACIRAKAADSRGLTMPETQSCGCVLTRHTPMSTEIHSMCRTHEIRWDLGAFIDREDRLLDAVNTHGWQDVWDAMWDLDGYDANEARRILHDHRPEATP